MAYKIVPQGSTPSSNAMMNTVNVPDWLTLSAFERELAGMSAGAGIQQSQIAASAQLEIAQMEYAYLRERMRALEIPEMQWADERQRHQLALQAVSDYAAQTGWYFNPTYIERQYGAGEDGAAKWEPFPTTAQGMAELGARPTMQAIEYAANPRNFVGALMMGGMSPDIATSYTQGLVGNLMGPNMSAGQPMGFQLDPRSTLQGLLSGSQQIPLMSSLVSAQGKEPDQFWTEFQNALPYGAPIVGSYA